MIFDLCKCLVDLWSLSPCLSRHVLHMNDESSLMMAEKALDAVRFLVRSVDLRRSKISSEDQRSRILQPYTTNQDGLTAWCRRVVKEEPHDYLLTSSVQNFVANLFLEMVDERLANIDWLEDDEHFLAKWAEPGPLLNTAWTNTK